MKSLENVEPFYELQQEPSPINKRLLAGAASFLTLVIIATIGVVIYVNQNKNITQASVNTVPTTTSQASGGNPSTIAEIPNQNSSTNTPVVSNGLPLNKTVAQ